MKLHRVSGLSTDGSNETVVWVTSEAAAGKARKIMVGAGIPRARIETKEHEVPTRRSELAAFLTDIKA